MKSLLIQPSFHRQHDSGASTTTLRFDPSLAEAVVLREMSRREAAGDVALAHTYRCLSDPLYDLPSEEEREQGFARLHVQLFEQLGFSKQVRDALAEFPDVTRKVRRVFVNRAFTRTDEGADLSQDAKSVGISLMANRFEEVWRLRAFLRHELMHVADMLDEAFGYDRDDGLLTYLPAQRNIIRDRYRVLWDVTIDGRLTRTRKETVASRGDRYREFSALFANLPELQRLQIFERLWGAEGVKHGELLAMAQGQQGFWVLGFGLWNDDTSHPAQRGILCPPRTQNPEPLVGSPCPLCKFPTYEWARDLEEDVAEAVRGDFPQWQSEQGICERCAELYRMRAGRW
jgi:hypothetical protein